MLNQLRSLRPCGSQRMHAATFTLALAASLACGVGSVPALPPANPGAGEAPPSDPMLIFGMTVTLRAVLGSGARAEFETIELLSEQPALCLGEVHDRVQDHLVEARLVTALAERAAALRRPIAVGFEMLPDSVQPQLDAFARGELSLDALPQAVQWDENWGYPFSYYAPILEAARLGGAALLALNVPRAVTRAIAKEGLQRATAELAQQGQPPLPELKLDDPEHREFFARAMSGSGHPMSVRGFENYYAAQVTWDETMAERAVRWLTKTRPLALPLPQVIIIAGAGHCHRSAIPRRITRRSALRAFGCKLNDTSVQQVPPGSAFDALISID